MTRELVGLFDTTAGLKLRVATVVSVAGGKAVISFGGDNTSGVPYLNHLAPRPGHTVIVASSGKQHLIIGSPSSGVTGYQNMTLASGFVTPDWACPASYRIIGDRVHLAGAIAKASGDIPSDATTQVATIAAEARVPYGTANMAAAAQWTSGARNGVARLDIESDGRVLARPATLTTWIGLDGLSYWLR